MTIAEIIRFYSLRDFVPYSAFVYACLPARRTTASWWTDMGAPADDSDIDINIGSLLLPPNVFYSRVTSIADCQRQTRSFYWDTESQMLYIHIEQEVLPVKESFSSGVTFGYTDDDIIYIDDVVYKPLLKSIPSLAKQTDLAQYDRMAFVSGEMILDNTGADFDDIIDDAIYGNDVFIYHLDGTADQDYERSDLVPLEALYIEDYDFSLAELIIKVQDKRKAQNANIISEFFADGKPVPLVYGTVAGLEAKPIDTSEPSVEFRAAQVLTSLGTVQCEGEFGWQTVTPLSYDLADGTFVVSALYARSPGNGLGEDTGRVLACRVLGATGIANSSALDVIADINDRILGIEYSASNYDTTAWEAAESDICAIGVAFDKQVAVYEAIRRIQDGCNIGFRYEVGADGLRTVRIDDWDASSVGHVSWFDIKDNLSLKVASDSSVLAGTCKALYAYDYASDAWSSYIDDSMAESVLLRYRQSPSIEVELMATAEADAIERASYMLERFSSIPRYADLTLHGSEWYALKLYDIVTVELQLPAMRHHGVIASVADRPYFGTWKAQVLAVNPGFGELENSVRLALIERV